MSDTIESQLSLNSTSEPDSQMALYQKFIDSLKPVALLLRPQTREIVAFNKAGQDIGVTVGGTCYESWANRKTPCPWCQAPKVWKNGETVRCQAEGEGRIWDAHWVSITDDRYLHYAREITEKVENENAQKESEEKYRVLIERESDAAFSYDPKTTKILDANEATSRRYGYDKDELTDMSCLTLRAEVEDSVSSTDKIQESGEVKTYHLKKDGTVFAGDSSGHSITLGGKKVMFAVSKGNTERQRTEEILRRKSLDLAERIKELRGLYGLSHLTGNPNLTPEKVAQQAVELLPPAWPYPEITCAKITMLGKVYTTANYVDCVWKQVAEVWVFNDAVGSIEVGFLKKMPQPHDGPFLLEKRELIDAMARELGQYLGRYQSEQKFCDSHTRLIESLLDLEDKNTALSELVDHVEREKQDLACRIQSNADRVIGPALTRLEAQITDSQKDQLAVIRSSLDNLTSPFISRLEQGMTHLTPREVEICSLIRNGLSSKNVAQNLHTSEATIKTQRKTIRRKLGLAKSKVNLATYLQQV